MSDRELLELAAKAAGLELFWRGDKPITPARGYWNPLTDDGDALRLAVKLRLDISPQPDEKVEVVNQYVLDEDIRWAWESYGDDAPAATRRAIVRAAASIGEHQP